MLSILHQSGPSRGRWNPRSKSYKMTPSRYDPGKLTLLPQKMTSFWPFGGYFWARQVRDKDPDGAVSAMTPPSLDDTTMTGNGSSYFEIRPWEVDLAPQKSDPFLAIFDPFWTRFWNRYWEIVLSMLHRSGPLGGSLESLHQGLQNDTTMSGNGSGYFVT